MYTLNTLHIYTFNTCTSLEWFYFHEFIFCNKKYAFVEADEVI